MKVFVYRNLHKKCLSVRDTKTRRVVAHVKSITLFDCTFKVSDKGRQRVLRDRQKNVHAGVQGTWMKDTMLLTAGLKRVIYNPYKYETFVDEIGLTPRHTSEVAVVTTEGAFVPQ